MQNFELFLLIAGVVIIVGFFAVAIITTRQSNPIEDTESDDASTVEETAVEPMVATLNTSVPSNIEPVIVTPTQHEPKTLTEEFTPTPAVANKLTTPVTEAHDPEPAEFADDDIHSGSQAQQVAESQEPLSKNQNPFTNGEWMNVIRKTFKERVDVNQHRLRVHEQQMGGLIIINVMAPHGYSFFGGDVFEVLNKIGLRFGELGIFHKFNPQGKKLFSVSSAVEPGYFDINNINLMSTAGLTCFFDLDEVENPKYSYRTLLAAAHELAHFLGAEIYDHNHEPLNQMSIQSALQRIKALDAVRTPLNAD